MKTKLLLTMCLAFMLSGQIHAQFITSEKVTNPIHTQQAAAATDETNGNEIIYQICGDDVERASGNSGVYEQRAYIRMPGRQWKGCKITNIEIGMGNGHGKLGSTYVFISKDTEQDPIVQQYFPNSDIPEVSPGQSYLIGWHNVPLNEAYTIDSDDDLYIGWRVIQEWGSYPCLALDNNPPIEGANLGSYRLATGGEWIYKTFPNNVSIRITLEGNLPKTHMSISSCSLDKLYYYKGDEMKISGTVTNSGLLPVNSFDLIYQLNDNEPVTQSLNVETMNSQDTYDFSYYMPINDAGRGKMTITVSNPNGKPDDVPDATSATFDRFGCLEKRLQKNVFVDELVGVNDAKAASAAQIIQNAIDNCERKDNVIWLQNHAISSDKYSINGYGRYETLFSNVVFTPAVNIDHQVKIPGTLKVVDEYGNLEPATGELFVIDENFGNALEYCLDKEVFFSLGLSCEVINDNELNITMSVRPAIDGLFPSLIKPSIALLIVEDKIVGPQAGVEGDYIHNGVPRAFINDGNPEFAYVGDEVPFPNDGFELETEYTITNPSWNIDNLKLIFYVIDGNMIIHNAVSCPVKAGPSNIAKGQAGETDRLVRCTNGVLKIEGEFEHARIFTIDGRQVIATNEAETNVSKLAKGIYCVQIQNGKQVVSKKFTVE